MTGPVAEVVAQMQQRLDALPPELAHRRSSSGPTCGPRRRSARHRRRPVRGPGLGRALGRRLRRAVHPAHDADRGRPGRDVPRPWRLAFDSPAEQPALRQVLVGINAHVNYDLPQALLAVISDRRLHRPGVLDRRRRDHERIDAVCPARVGAEDDELSSGGRAPARPGPRTAEPVGLQAVPARVAAEGLAQRDRAAAGPTGRPRGVRRTAGRARGAQRGPDRRPARAGSGASSSWRSPASA